jgi:asparagine synthetase B (glutamine-hydrolysing)
MTAIVGLFGSHDPQIEARARRALEAMRADGSELIELFVDPDAGVALGAASDTWQVGAGLDSARLAQSERAAVVTDASLYYLQDLTRAVQASGYQTSSQSPAALILAAYSAWGDQSLQHLEGDFALIIWDRRERRLVAARDHGGTRPLFYAAYEGGLAVASRLDGIVSLPRFNAQFNPISLGDDALFLRVHMPESTAYAAIKRIQGGHRLDWRPGAAPRVERWWEVPFFVRGDGPPYEEAVQELRRLIIASVAERTKHPEGSVVWLSGGYDSPSLFAASQEGARANGGKAAEAVSIQYPPDDPGYEDDYIEATTSFWKTTPNWVDVTAIPALENPMARAKLRDEPIHHMYELWNAALAQKTRARGRRVALIGNGGDQFFSSTTVRLADHLRSGRLITLATEWREAGGGWNWRLFGREVVAPNLPNRVLAVANALRQGRALQHRLARPVAAWANRAFEHYGALEALNRATIERRPGESHASLDQSWGLRHITAERLAKLLSSIALLNGVEVRSPLFDGRVIRFASGRPLSESYSKRENKRLLRGAFKGLLPEKVLGPRPTRTGLPVRYLKRTAAAHAAWAVQEWLNGMILADLGVIDGKKFLDVAREIPSRGLTDLEQGVAVIATVQTECWLRARQGH